MCVCVCVGGGGGAGGVVSCRGSNMVVAIAVIGFLSWDATFLLLACLPNDDSARPVHLCGLICQHGGTYLCT